MKQERLIAICSVLLVAWGLLGTLGVLGRARTLRLLAHASLASPILVVYTDREGQRNMQLRANLELSYKDGKKESFTFDKTLYAKLSAAVGHPLNRHLITLPYIAAVSLLIDKESNPEMRRSILHQGFCNRGPMTEYLQIKREVQALSVSFDSIVPQPIPPTLELSC